VNDQLPERLIVVVGTATEVGKTWVAAHALAALRGDGVSVAARKPVQSFAPDDATTDAAVLAAATGEEPTEVCPPHRWYEVPMAPPMAAEALGRPPFTIADLVDEIHWPGDTEVGIVETAGGVRSPMASDDPGDAVTLIAALIPEVVVVVADAELGTINGVRLTVTALEPVLERREGVALVIFVNRYDPENDLHRRNLSWLRDHDGVTIVSSIEELLPTLRAG
jgi:dethiobiotin synthetase